MNILFVNHTSKFSGAELVLRDYLNQSNDFYKLVILPPGPFADILRSDGIPLIEARGISELNRKKNKLWIFYFIKRYVTFNLQLLKILISNNIDIIYCNTFTSAIYCFVISKIMKKPIIWHMHDIFPENSIESKVAKILGKYSNRIIAVSNAVKRYLISLEINPDKIEVIYNGIDFENKFNPSNYKKLKSDTKRKVIITMVGLLTEWKGFHILLEAIGLLENEIKNSIEVRIVGDNWEGEEYKNTLYKIVEKHNLNNIVKFLGRRTDIPEIFNESDVVIHASIWEDPLPTVILEAMSMCKIVVASKIGGVPEIIINGKNGFIFEPNNIKELALLLNEIVPNLQRNKEHYNYLVNNARKTIVEKFNPKHKKRKLYKVYETILSKY
ncbi:glycosyltransferase family 4 protein [Bacillus smithii]|uniref:glycosyltransferase family 4 protein n=1 Tax=Bacillus smithii TaxID=1479 RepID=UPI0022DFAD0B|nr:glycosyltransferase family 4 protein [Bacillus smithii]